MYFFSDGGCDWFGLVVLGGVPHPLLGLRHRVERFPDCHQVKKKADALSPELIISPFPGSSTCCGWTSRQSGTIRQWASSSWRLPRGCLTRWAARCSRARSSCSPPRWWSPSAMRMGRTRWPSVRWVFFFFRLCSMHRLDRITWLNL